MKGKLAIALIALYACGLTALAEPTSAIRIILVGASTVTPHTGWGGVFCSARVHQLAGCLNLARGGRSTKTYRDEGWWKLVMNELDVTGYDATYVLIEMGHNDKSERPEVGTDLEEEFSANLRGFVEEVRSKGAIPVLVTPLSTRHFKDHQLVNTLEPWARKTRDVARATSAPMVELNAESAAFFQRTGAEGAMAFSSVAPTERERAAAAVGTTLKPRLPSSVPVTPETPEDDQRREYTQDYLHINSEGANGIATIVARQLAVAVPALGPYLVLK